MITKRILKNVSPQLIYQAALRRGIECKIESSRFNLFSMMVDEKKVYVNGTNLSVNSQSSSSISNNKYLSKKIFKKNGILVPKSWLVRTVNEARELIVKNNIFPCVIKPINGSHGNEIFANIESIEELNTILAEFKKSDHKNILIEEHMAGLDLRVLVVGDAVSATLERIPAHIVGDGKSTIRSLIKKFNAQPLVGKKYEKPLCRILINFELVRSLRKSNLKITSIPDKGTIVTLKQTANISVGGISRDVTDTTSDNTKKTALGAAQALGMEFCGVDIIYNPNTQKSYVLEVNNCPGIDIHHYPVIGDAQDVAGDIVDYIISKETEKASWDSTQAFTTAVS